MKRWMTFLLCIAYLIPITASAHSGGTDSKGGHWNRSTGEYHYHHGYSAHQHKDMNGDGILDCPYEFDDKTKYKEKINRDIVFPTVPEFTEPALSEYNKKIIESVERKSGSDDSMSPISIILIIILFAGYIYISTISNTEIKLLVLIAYIPFMAFIVMLSMEL